MMKQTRILRFNYTLIKIAYKCDIPKDMIIILHFFALTNNLDIC